MIYTLTLNPALDRELTVPEIVPDCVLRAVQSRVDCGGKGFNVSRQLSRLGAQSTAVGFLGGKAGELLEEGLRGLGISTEFTWIAGETRTNTSIVTPAGGQYIKVNEAGPVISAENQDDLLDKIRRLARAGDWWVLAGSLPPGLPDSFYAQVVSLLNQRGGRTVLDTVGQPLRLGCQAQPFLVKPNLEEACDLTGTAVDSPEDILRAAAQIRAMGVENVIISLGKGGALLHSLQGSWLARSPAVVEKNPIGAGDALVGGLVWALARGLALPAALRIGAACGAAAASLSGTETGTLEMVEALARQVQVESLPYTASG